MQTVISVLQDIVQALVQYLLVAAFLLRVILPLARANMRNPLAQAVLRVTNPIVLPLRRVLPPVRRVDTASVVALLLVQLATTAVILWLSSLGGFSSHPFTLAWLVRNGMFALCQMTLQTYMLAMIIYVVLSWVAPTAYSPAIDMLTSFCEPPLRFTRRIIPAIGGLDLSPVFVFVAIAALLKLLPVIFF